MGRLTTHVLDTARGRPAAGLALTLSRLDPVRAPQKLVEAVTNDDGRCDGPLLEGEALVPGRYELVFHAGPYLAAAGLIDPAQGPAFLDDVPVRFGISDAGAHYHVPLLLSPYGYSTYRGS